jgi:hypothetical protein
MRGQLYGRSYTRVSCPVRPSGSRRIYKCFLVDSLRLVSLQAGFYSGTAVAVAAVVFIITTTAGVDGVCRRRVR